MAFEVQTFSDVQFATPTVVPVPGYCTKALVSSSSNDVFLGNTTDFALIPRSETCSKPMELAVGDSQELSFISLATPNKLDIIWEIV